MKILGSVMIAVNGFDVGFAHDSIANTIVVGIRKSGEKEPLSSETFDAKDAADVAAAFDKMSALVTVAVQSDEIGSKQHA